MKWFHECDIEWMKARRGFLTATDIKELLPITKTGRKRVVDNESYFKILARKKANITQDDCISTGAAARGHILEPYAIKFFNEHYGSSTPLIHWDDVIIGRRPDYLSLAFSPDAMDIPMVDNERPVSFTTKMKIIGEVKSYSNEKHFICGNTPKEYLEERWQIATAMAVAENIEQAYLIFFNPSVKPEMFFVQYDRDDLKEEIKIVLRIEQDFSDWYLSSRSVPINNYIVGNDTHEIEIINKIMKDEEFNPENKRSVTR